MIQSLHKKHLHIIRYMQFLEQELKKDQVRAISVLNVQSMFVQN